MKIQWTIIGIEFKKITTTRILKDKVYNLNGNHNLQKLPYEEKSLKEVDDKPTWRAVKIMMKAITRKKTTISVV